MDRRVWWATAHEIAKSLTQVNNWAQTIHMQLTCNSAIALQDICPWKIKTNINL